VVGKYSIRPLNALNGGLHGLAKFDPLHGDLNRRVPVERIALLRSNPTHCSAGCSVTENQLWSSSSPAELFFR
jgi:hypothetical protein